MFYDELSLNNQINCLYDSLQQAREERDKYKKALEEMKEMNQHILIAMDRKNRSKEELIENYIAAGARAAGARAAYYVAKYATLPFFDANTEYWLNRYFEITGEDREEYEKALEEIVRQGRGSLDYYLVAKEALNETK
jgi:hypothetical protein